MSVEELKPCYKFDSINNKTLIDEDHVEVVCDGESYHGHGKVYLELMPLPRFVVEVEMYEEHNPTSLFAKYALENKEIEVFKYCNTHLNGYLAHLVTGVEDHNVKIVWYAQNYSLVQRDVNSDLSRVVFHLFNFRKLLDCVDSVDERDGDDERFGKRLNYVVLKSHGWKITVKEVYGCDDILEKLRVEGGYGVTHVGEIKKDNGTLFTLEESKDVLDSLTVFFSFVKGTNIYPDCWVGYSEDRRCVVQCWAHTANPYHSSSSCFGYRISQQMKLSFPLYFHKWVDSDWKETLKQVVMWYCRASNSWPAVDISTSIMLSQAAIEKMSYFYTVCHKKLLSKDGFKKLIASDILRILFSSLSIPLEIPDFCESVQDLVAKNIVDWTDSPHALTVVRNSIVHFENKLHGKVFLDHKYELRNLYLWYIEMSILASIGYDGTYHPRVNMHIGGEKPVPWHSVAL